MIQKIKLYRKQVLTKDNIYRILNRARSTYSYARFDLDNGLYLTINYNRDNTISISTNSRDIVMWNQIKFLMISYTQARLADFVFLWINRLNN